MFVDGGLYVLHTGQELFLHPGERHHLDTERLAQRAAGRLQEKRVHGTQSRDELHKDGKHYVCCPLYICRYNKITSRLISWTTETN